MDVFSYSSYRDFLISYIKLQPNEGRGWKGKLARHLGCHSSYISNILKSKAELSLEQAWELNKLIGHTPAQADFFLLLVQKDRAGTESLKKYWADKIKSAIDDNRLIQNRIHGAKSLSLENQVRYYSDPNYISIHVLVSIEKYQTVEFIAKSLRISELQAVSYLQELRSMELVDFNEDKWFRTESQIHLDGDSPLIKKHHQNWRLKALDNLNGQKGLHYSSVIGVSLSDGLKIQELMLNTIETIRAIVKASKEESVYCYNLDFFKLLNHEE